MNRYWCQAKGKIVTLSLGGATGAVGFANASQAESFAELIWGQFLGRAYGRLGLLSWMGELVFVLMFMFL